VCEEVTTVRMANEEGITRSKAGVCGIFKDSLLEFTERKTNFSENDQNRKPTVIS
jgi:hypothetical protein